NCRSSALCCRSEPWPAIYRGLSGVETRARNGLHFFTTIARRSLHSTSLPCRRRRSESCTVSSSSSTSALGSYISMSPGIRSQIGSCNNSETFPEAASYRYGILDHDSIFNGDVIGFLEARIESQTGSRLVKIFMQRDCSSGVSRQDVLDSKCHVADRTQPELR